MVADKATNTLIITADRDDYRIIEDVIRKLDIPRPMVYIEALIMEVSVTKSFNIGVEWRGLREVGTADISGLGPNATALGMAGFTGSSIIPQLNAATGAVSMPAGFSLGVIGAGIQIGSVLFPNIGAVLQAYQNDSDVSILATPQLLTLNNEDAEINVGKNVPYITRPDTSATVPGADYGQSYEYKDVGVILKITPNINEEQFVRLKIDQQVTKLADAQTTTTPTTLKRTAKTTVVVKDKETVVIGGMIDDSTSVTTDQVPCLGDIPFLGWLFKTMSKGRDKSNLFIFITPHIVRNQAEAAAIYQTEVGRHRQSPGGDHQDEREQSHPEDAARPEGVNGRYAYCSNIKPERPKRRTPRRRCLPLPRRGIRRAVSTSAWRPSASRPMFSPRCEGRPGKTASGWSIF